MLYRSLLRRATLLHFTTTGLNSIRPAFASTMAVPPSSYTLDRSIFNQNLYSSMWKFWFADTPPDAGVASFPVMQKWFGINSTEAEKEEYDDTCRQKFQHALAAIGPDKLALPPFESYEREVEDAATLSAPLLAEVKTAQAEDEKKGTETLISLVLLLDQMTRNMNRDPAGLNVVYTHYDRLAYTLLRASLDLPTNLVAHSFYARKPVYKLWMLMPLIHSEHLPSHELWSRIANELRRECEGDEELLKYIDLSMKAEKDHVVLIERFGRYPHRNEFVGRVSTSEEEAYLVDADTFGVKSSKKESGKGKDEL